MAKVHLLTPSLSNMIAAGEVVERPKSVVKELVENSIDANASQIDIIIKNAGRDLIRIIDDGDGMDKDDAILAIKRHATSKLLDEHDLFNIETLGFRGEALPSIAAVSNLKITTSTGEGLGTHLEVEASKIIKEENAPLRKGTKIEVSSLFYNTPARLKYLKSDNTEFSLIHDTVLHIALGYPHIIFNLIHNDRDVFKTSGNGNVLEIISQIYGKETAKNMLKVNFANYNFEVEGYTSKIEYNRSNRQGIVILINGRYIHNNQISNALINAYKTYLPDSRYPIAVLNIKVDPSLVDINVHPSKHEVRLSLEGELTKLIEEGTSNLLKSSLLTPSFVKKEVKEIVITPSLDLESENFFLLNEDSNDTPLFNDIKELNNETSTLDINLDNEAKKVEVSKIKANVYEEKSFKYFRIIGQFKGTYILVEVDEGIYIVDQHAAAERINFEKYSKLLGTSSGQVELLVPLLMEYSLSEISLIEENKNVLETLGIYYDVFMNSIRISKVPDYFVNVDMKVYFENIVELLKKKSKVTTYDIRLDAIATIACKASIKANHHLNEKDMEDLIRNLLKCENPNTCPHGRPVMLKYSVYELEKFFKRSGV